MKMNPEMYILADFSELLDGENPEQLLNEQCENDKEMLSSSKLI
jgi:hypothetical protein